MSKMNVQSIGTLIGRAFRILKYDLQKEFQNLGYDLTLEQWVLLVILKHRDGISQHEISNIIKKEKTTITRLIDGLEKRNLIMRVQDKNDRRNNLIYLNKEGGKAETALTPIATKLNQKALNGFSEEEKEIFLGLLNKMINNFEC